MPRTTTSTKRTTTSRRPKLDTGGRPKGKGKGGIVAVHGITTTGYQRGCRCDECTATATAYKRALRERKAKTVKAAKPTRAPKPQVKAPKRKAA
jgi:hypothetical protein